jgi:hypothetical protein
MHKFPTLAHNIEDTQQNISFYFVTSIKVSVGICDCHKTMKYLTRNLSAIYKEVYHSSQQLQHDCAL